MPLHVANRRTNPETLQRRFESPVIIDVTSKGQEPWVRLSPFYPNGGIPVPFSPDVEGACVEGIWQALKVFETEDVDESKLHVTTMKGLKRTVRRLGKVRGHRRGIHGDELLPYREARELIYLPACRWVLEHRVQPELAELQRLAADRDVVLLDYQTNGDVDDLSKPLSHAALIKRYLEGDWPTRETKMANSAQESGKLVR